MNGHIESETHLDTTLTKLIKSRHSTRAFKPDPVPNELLEQCLSLAQYAPSNSNIQPWRLTIVQDAGLRRLEQALLEAVEAKVVPQITPIPEAYIKHRSDMGHALYGPEGYNITRGDKAAMEAARRRNYTFFDAPLGMIVCIDSALAAVDVLSVGLYLQALCLLLQERGLASCIEVSVAGYPDVIRKELGIGENMMVLCGLAIGFEDDSQNVNHLKTLRDAWKESVTIVKE